MACLDGLDGYTALLADSANYKTAGYNSQVLNQSYYESHTYLTVYNDFGNDGEWLFFLMHRSIFPEYYPGYRRDQYYMVLNPGAYPYNYYGYSYYHFYMPSRSIGIGYSGGYSNRYFGPQAPPRPYGASTPWYSANRPGMTASPTVGKMSATHFSPGSYGGGQWGKVGSMGASGGFKSTPFAGGSSGTFSQTTTSSGAKSLYGGSSGGFGGSGSGSSGS